MAAGGWEVDSKGFGMCGFFRLKTRFKGCFYWVSGGV